MVPWETTARLVTGLVLVLLNAFFVVTEFALTRLRQYPEERFQQDRQLRRAWRMTERLELYLTSCQLGITSTTIILGVVTEPAVTALIMPLLEWTGVPVPAIRTTSVVLAIIVLNLIHKIWGEQAPTYLGIERPIQVARWIATPHYWWTRAVYPLVILGDGMAKATLRVFGVRIRRSWTKETTSPDSDVMAVSDMRRAIGEVLTRGRITADRRREVLNALRIEEIPVRDIMVPRDRIVSIDHDADYDAISAALEQRAHTRLPVRKGDGFHGVVYVPALVPFLEAIRTEKRTVTDSAVAALRIPADMPVSRAIDRFQDARQELALVEEDGHVVGLITVTDTFEAIAGQLEDPYD